MKNILYAGFMLCFFTLFSQEKEVKRYKQQSYRIDTLSINTDESDFGVNYINDQEIVFSSPKKNQLFARKWRENGQRYLELYKAKVGSTGSVGDVEKYSKKINSKYHEAELIFTKDKKRVYFTSNNHTKGKKNKKSSEGYNNLQLYKADVVLGEYKNIELLPFNSKEYSTGHPVLSKNDEILYFVSDRPGGYGNTDLYSVAVLEGDKFGEVTNLGARINSSEKEMFPFIDVDGILYFSSDRVGGKGGLDVYGISLEDLKDTIYQMPSPINSEQDDFAFVLGKDKYGFLSSNREGGKGDDDIYKLILNCQQYLSGVVLNKKDSTALKEAKVFVYKNDLLLDSLITNSEGKFNSSIVADCESNYFIEADKLYFRKDSTTVQTSSLRGHNNFVTLNLDPMACLQKLLGTVKDSKTREFIAFADVYLYKNEILIDSVVTDKQGSYKFNTPITCEHEYLVRADKKYFESASKNMLTSKVNDLENIVNLDLIPYIVDNKIVIDPIYFDYDKSFIRPDAAMILNRVVDVMNKYPNLIVEGGSHTDSRGNEGYNEALSARRAKSTVDYIISKGISSARISSKGYGETQLINRCSNGVKCSKEEHQLNRRTEFKIIKR